MLLQQRIPSWTPLHILLNLRLLLTTGDLFVYYYVLLGVSKNFVYNGLDLLVL